MKIPETMINISEIERQLRKFIANMKKIGIAPAISHLKEEHEILILIDVWDIIRLLKKHIQYGNVEFKLAENYIVLEVKY